MPHRFSKGFTLIEVLIAIVILASAMAFIMEGMGRSQQAIQIAENLITGSLMAEEELTQIKMRAFEENTLRPQTTSGSEKKSGRTFDWTQSISDYSDETLTDATKLNQITASIQWKETANRSNNLEIVSLMANKEKEKT